MPISPEIGLFFLATFFLSVPSRTDFILRSRVVSSPPLVTTAGDDS